MVVDEIRIRMAKLSGKILDRCANFVLAQKYEHMFINFYKGALADKN